MKLPGGTEGMLNTPFLSARANFIKIESFSRRRLITELERDFFSTESVNSPRIDDCEKTTIWMARKGRRRNFLISLLVLDPFQVDARSDFFGFYNIPLL